MTILFRNTFLSPVHVYTHLYICKTFYILHNLYFFQNIYCLYFILRYLFYECDINLRMFIYAYMHNNMLLVK